MKQSGEAVKVGSAARAPAVVGYIRVSTTSQDHQSQRHAIELAARARGQRIERWFADTATGGRMDRPQLVRLRAELARGNVSCIWVWRINRLSRSGIADTLTLAEEVKRAGAALISVADGFALEGPAAPIVLAVIAFAAQLELDQLHENQAAARAAIEARGGSWGRPRLPPHKRDGVAPLVSQGKSRSEIATELQISESSVRKVLKDLGLAAAAEKTPRRGG